MACLHFKKYTCQKCGEVKEHHTTNFYISVCPYCERKDVEKKEREYFEALDSLSMEERIRKIEKWIYDYKPPSNPMMDLIG